MNPTFTRIAQIIRKALDRKSGMDVRFFGVLGQNPFTEDTVLTDQTGIVNFTEISTGIVHQVLNRRVPNRAFEYVAVGYDPAQPGVLQVLYSRDVYGDQDTSPDVPDHAETHRLGGGDTDFVEAERIQLFLVLPYSGFTVQVFGGTFPKADGTVGLLANQLVDLSSYQPTAGAKYVHLQYDEAGTITVVDGTEVDVKELLTVADIPPATEIPLHAVRLYDGQEQLQRVPNDPRNDFVDTRFGGRMSASSVITITAKRAWFYD
jgi:hypothetical protein